ncbi:MAG: hypothetical protein AAFZ15_20550 [Bacteroidota bacterium]
MDGKTSSKLTGLISKLTLAANKAVNKKKKEQQFSQRPDQNFNHRLKLTQLEKNLRPA